MNEKRNHFQQYLPQTEVALTVEAGTVLKSTPQSLDTLGFLAVWDAVPCTQIALAPAMPTKSSEQSVSCLAAAADIAKDQEKSSEHKAY